MENNTDTETHEGAEKQDNSTNPTVMKLVRYPKAQHQVDETYGKVENATKSVKDLMTNAVNCSKTDVLRYILNLFHVVSVAKSYKIKQYLLGDFLSGITVTCLHFPQGLAFGLLASLAPKYGLYVSFFPVIFYSIFGTSPHISVGTNPIIALLISDLVETHVQFNFPNTTVNETLGNLTSAFPAGNEDAYLTEKAALAAGVSLSVGIIFMSIGFLRLGFIASILSSSFVSAFTTAAACHIITSQIPKTLGLKLPPIHGEGKLIYIYIALFGNIGQSNIGTMVVSVTSLVLLVFFKDFINEKYKNKMKMPVPIDIIVVTVATIASHFCHFANSYDIAIVGEIPSGLPVPAFPVVRSSHFGEVFIITVILFVFAISMSRVCEMKHNYEVNIDQELIAHGISNFGSSFFYCFPAATAPARTMILSSMGAKTTLNGIFTAISMLLILLLLGQYFTSLPISVLAAMVIVAIKYLLVQVKEVPVLWRTNKYDLVIWIGTAGSGIFIDLPYSLYVGAILCMSTVILQGRLCQSYSLSKTARENLFLNSKCFPSIAPYHKITIFRMESSLYFATAEVFRDRLYTITGDPRKIKQPTKTLKVGNTSTNEREMYDIGSKESQQNTLKVKYVIIDCSSVNYIDMNGVNAIRQTEIEYSKVDIHLMFVRCTLCMLNMLEKSVLSHIISRDRIFPDIVDAIHAIDVLEQT